MSAESLIGAVKAWAALRDDIRALALVGSYARGDAHAGSDIDLVLVCSEPARYLSDSAWASAFGDVTRVSLEDWGKVQSLRVHYANGLEVELGITNADWTTIPPDRGTAAVVRNGLAVLLDRDGRLEKLVEHVRRSA